MIENMTNSVVTVRESHKIGMLIPCTSNGRDWKNFKETFKKS